MKVINVVSNLVPDVFADIDLKPSKFIEKYWNRYIQNNMSNQNINGKVLEELIAMTMARSKILPFYVQASVALIPNVNYDFVFYSEIFGPIVLSSKVSLRERYKQADLEAVALKNVYRKSESFVVTLNSVEVQARQKDISSAMAIDNFILATSDEFDALVDHLKSSRLALAPSINIVESNAVITSENYLDVYSRYTTDSDKV